MTAGDIQTQGMLGCELERGMCVGALQPSHRASRWAGSWAASGTTTMCTRTGPLLNGS
jgi:hypothetical protein